jgi:hypothetical protein
MMTNLLAFSSTNLIVIFLGCTLELLALNSFIVPKSEVFFLITNVGQTLLAQINLFRTYLI